MPRQSQSSSNFKHNKRKHHQNQHHNIDKQDEQDTTQQISASYFSDDQDDQREQQQQTSNEQQTLDSSKRPKTDTTDTNTVSKHQNAISQSHASNLSQSQDPKQSLSEQTNAAAAAAAAAASKPVLKFGAPEFQNKNQAKLIIVLVKSSLETIKARNGFELISQDTHKAMLHKHGKDPSLYRPDITHQCLLTLLDSPINKSGLLKIYIQTENNVLISVNPSIRIPRTFRRFAGLIVQLLHKLKIKSEETNETLLSVIKNPITQHLPAGSICFGTSELAELTNIYEFAELVGGKSDMAKDSKLPIVFALGAHAHGPEQVDWTEKSISVSKYPLSASTALNRILSAFEKTWNIY